MSLCLRPRLKCCPHDTYHPTVSTRLVIDTSTSSPLPEFSSRLWDDSKSGEALRTGVSELPGSSSPETGIHVHVHSRKKKCWTTETEDQAWCICSQGLSLPHKTNLCWQLWESEFFRNMTRDHISKTYGKLPWQEVTCSQEKLRMGWQKGTKDQPTANAIMAMSGEMIEKGNQTVLRQVKQREQDNDQVTSIELLWFWSNSHANDAIH